MKLVGVMIKQLVNNNPILVLLAAGRQDVLKTEWKMCSYITIIVKNTHNISLHLHLLYINCLVYLVYKL